jgi:putative ABC transport system ATP-binding protein
VLELAAISKVYRRRGSEVVALRAPSLVIPAGDYVAVVGPSGSGKTTLLSMLGGMLSPTAGRVLIDGESLYDLRPARRAELRRQQMGFVFQTFNLVPYLSAVENVEVPLYLAGHPRDEQRRRATELLERIGLGERLDHKPSELSTGQQQRVALARTLANDPPVILADEPTGNLDAESRSLVLDFLDRAHADGRTIVMVTHDQAAAARASRKLRIENGAIVPSAPATTTRAA